MAYLFTSESVSEGHPDKVADQISDALLDEFLRRDPESKVACETLVTTGLVVFSGEVKTNAYVDVQQVAREVIRKIGYTIQIICLKLIHAGLSHPFMNNRRILTAELKEAMKKIRVPVTRA